MRSKGKPSCGGWGCNPCEADRNPCLVLTVEDPITIVLDEAPTDYTVEDMEEFLPEDLPRDLRYFCVWNSTTGKYECNYHTPGATDTEESASLVIADRHGSDVLYRSVTYDTAPNNLCDGERWYGGASTEFPTEFRGSTFSTPASCRYAEPDGTSGYCNWGVLPGHVGDMSTGPWASLGGFPVKWHRVNVGGVLKVRITVGTPNGPGWWGETDFYRAGSTPTAPVFWWPIPSGSSIRLAWTPTVQDDGSAPIDDPLASAETSTFNPWPDILLTSCSNYFPPCEPYLCYPLCVANVCADNPDVVNYSLLFWHLECDGGSGEHSGQFDAPTEGSGGTYQAGDWPFTGTPTISCVDGVPTISFTLFGVDYTLPMTLNCSGGEASWVTTLTDPAGGGSGGGPGESCVLTIFTNNGGGA